MSTTMTLPVSDIIVVNVSVAAGAVAPRPFNQGLIVGPSTVIPSYGANPRVRQYANLDEMLADGWAGTEPEYLAAEIYFGQSPTPQLLWVGRQDLTALFAAIPHSGNAGTGYVAGDLVTVGGGSNGQLVVLTVDGGGAVLTLGTQIGKQGTGYTVATETTTGGTGSGLHVDVITVGETYLQAVEAISLVTQEFYPFMCCGASDSDHLALAAFSSANWENMLYCGSSTDVAIPNGTAGNIALQIKALKYRALLTFNTTQGGTYPNNIYAAAAFLGIACGLTTGLAGSAFTLNLKSVEGVAAEPLTQTQFNAIRNANCNTVASFGPYLGYIFNGVLGSGEFYDQILGRAIYVNLIQTNLMNLLVSVPKVAQTDPAEHQLLAQVDAAAADLANQGFFGPGVWKGAPVLQLSTGQSLPQGYLNQAPPYAQQSAGDRAARKSMPIYSAVLEAGAVHSVLVQVLTQL